MASIINIELGQSTVTHPLGFFHKFYSRDVISRVRANFFSVLRIQQDSQYIPHYHFPENPDKDYIDIDWEIEDYDPENPGETHKRLWETKRIFFRVELTEYLKQQYFISRELLHNRLTSDVKESNKRKSIENEIIKIIRHLDFIEKNSLWLPYKEECKRPLWAIVRLIYNEYPGYKPHAEKVVIDILRAPDPLADYIPSSLKVSFAEDIMEPDIQGESMFFDEDEEHYDSVKDRLRGFITKAYNEITPPINIVRNIGAAYYLISQIAKINRITLEEIQSRNIFTIKGKSFKAGNCSKGKRSFLKANITLKKELDDLLKNHAF